MNLQLATLMLLGLFSLTLHASPNSGTGPFNNNSNMPGMNGPVPPPAVLTNPNQPTAAPNASDGLFSILFGQDQSQTPLISNIQFTTKPSRYSSHNGDNFWGDDDNNDDDIQQTYSLKMADIASPDPLRGCQIDNQSPELQSLVDHLVETVRVNLAYVHAIDDTNGCGVLMQHLDNSRQLLAGLLNSEVVPEGPQGAVATTVTDTRNSNPAGATTGFVNTTTTTTTVTSPNPQDLINNTIRKQNAVNEIVNTAGDLLQNNCINSTTDRATIQKISGQALSVAGALVGGWAGIVTSITGQILGSNALSESDLDKAIDGFRQYEKLTSEGAFLCSYREMQKTSCLMFSDPRQAVVGGLDTSFNSGPTKMTLEAISSVATVNPTPNLHEEMRFLKLVEDLHSRNEEDSIEHVTGFCQNDSWKYFQPADLFHGTGVHPQAIRDTFADLVNICDQLNGFQYPNSDQTKVFLSRVHDDFDRMSSYYNYNKAKHTELGRYAETWESLQFFDQFAARVNAARDPQGGNQFRVNFLGLIKALDTSMAQDAFTALFKQNEKTLKDKSNGPSVQKSAFKALIDLCETFDPTLTCLYPDGKSLDLHKTWESSCVGAGSRLCHDNTGDFVKDETRYSSYFNSLCPNTAK